MTTAPSPFLPSTSIQFAWDSTSLGIFKECARKYYYTMIRGFRLRGESVHLTFGIHYHSALEFYDKIRASDGLTHNEAVRATLRKVFEDTWDRENDRPWESDHPLKSRANLIRSVVWYLDNFEHDPAKTVILANGKPAVELSFKLPMDDELILCGHLDRLVEFSDGYYVMDRKTTTTTISNYYFDQYEPDNQMSLYALASKIIYNTPVRGVMIDAVQVAVGFSRFERGITYRTPSQLDEWYRQTKWWTGLARQMALEYSNLEGGPEPERAWPMNDKSCHKFGGCPFRSICSKDPGVRENFLESNYEVRHWNPLEVR